MYVIIRFHFLGTTFVDNQRYQELDKVRLPITLYQQQWIYLSQ
ncbi:hypothetical protein RINTU1_35630 [Candidatus Regiella insecticola]|uniref:Uncharacterized protein n=1 Tax=Candidatus Regiella insecticola TaxID=138073 RepID=A0A6L2ZSB9_9ENTR|nr:hypothetical protein RINTU1_35630 [Candidatus Regiella insecticola]